MTAWAGARGLSCPETPSLRRLTTRAECAGPLDVALLPDRRIAGVLESVLIVRVDEGPVHHVSTLRRYSAPEAAQADYHSAITALSAQLGPPVRSQRLDDLTVFSRPLARAVSQWTFDDLQVVLSVLKAAGDSIQVNEVWTLPGVEEQVGQRGEGSLHGKSRAPAKNPHILPDRTHPGW